MINHFKELYHDARYDDVVFMKDYYHAYIGFRKMLLLLDIESLYTFLLQVRRISENKSIWEQPGVQSLMIDTPCNGMALLVTKQELYRLQKMLETADDYFNHQRLHPTNKKQKING